MKLCVNIYTQTPTPHIHTHTPRLTQLTYTPIHPDFHTSHTQPYTHTTTPHIHTHTPRLPHLTYIPIHTDSHTPHTYPYTQTTTPKINTHKPRLPHHTYIPIHPDSHTSNYAYLNTSTYSWHTGGPKTYAFSSFFKQSEGIRINHHWFLFYVKIMRK